MNMFDTFANFVADALYKIKKKNKFFCKSSFLFRFCRNNYEENNIFFFEKRRGKLVKFLQFSVSQEKLKD